jgi:glycosyltransferase involved in cell wall biosynthesis
MPPQIGATVAPITPPRVAVLIPCLNEEITIGKVIDDFRAALPEAEVYVFDNNSTDRTAEIARARGATVVKEKRPGKGFVVQAMFRQVEADCYLMVDGDDTYSAPDARQLLAPLLDGQADMVVATRLAGYVQGSFPSLHVFGNRALTGIVNWVFATRLHDMMSGYRALTRDLARSVALLSHGFEVETELTLRVLEGRFVIQEVPLPYRERPAGSFSKLRTFRDGFRVLFSIFNVLRTYRPFAFYGSIGAALLAGGLVAGGYVLVDYLEDRYVDKVPTAILATGLVILAGFAFGMGLLLNTISERFNALAALVRLRSKP